MQNPRKVAEFVAKIGSLVAIVFAVIIATATALSGQPTSEVIMGTLVGLMAGYGLMAITAMFRDALD